jgi:hypothetical protein
MKRAPVESDSFLTKSEIGAINILIGGIDPRLAGSRARREEAVLFETLLITTRPASLRRRRISYLNRP